LSDEEWELIADLVPTWSGPGRIGRPAKHAKRDIVNAILYVAATGCQWRALPACYPNWNTVHRYHLAWSRDGTWEAIVDRLRTLVREREGRDPEPSAGIVDARSVQGASTVTAPTRGFDAGKRVSGRKTFGVVDTLGLLVAVVVVAANVSDNAGAAPAWTGPARSRPGWPSCGVTPGSSARSPGTVAATGSKPRSSAVPPPIGSRSCPAAGSWNAPGRGWSITAGCASTMNAIPLSPKASYGPRTPGSSSAASPPTPHREPRWEEIRDSFFAFGLWHLTRPWWS
jgi:transposase